MFPTAIFERFYILTPERKNCAAVNKEYGAFPVCRNYTVRAHIRDLGTAKRRGRENRIEYARTLRCGLHAPHLHARHAPDAGKCSRKDGYHCSLLHSEDSIQALRFTIVCVLFENC